MSGAERLAYSFANVAMRLVLRSPLHALFSEKILLLTITGRKSGRSYAVPVSYVDDGGTLICFTCVRWSNWWKNLRGGASVTVRLRGHELVGVAEVATGEDENVVRKLRAFLERFPGSARRYRVSIDPDRRSDLREVALAVRRRGPIMIRVEVG